LLDGGRLESAFHVRKIARFSDNRHSQAASILCNCTKLKR
jgi:hypothetical protein